MSACSPQDLDLLRFSGLSDVLGALDELHVALASEANHLVKVLHDAIPRLGAHPKLRRVVLSLKRDVHNARSFQLAASVARELKEHLGQETVLRLHEWQDRRRRLDMERAMLDERLARQLDAAGNALMAWVQDPGVLRSLALTRPALAAEWLNNPPTAEQAGFRTQRTAVAYLSRAAVKTSPLGGFTDVGFTGFDERVPQGVDSSSRAILHECRAVALSLLIACSRNDELTPVFTYQVNEALTASGKGWRFLHPVHRCHHGFFWRHEELTDVGLYAHLVRHALAVVQNGAAACHRMASREDDEAFRLRLLHTRILQARGPWARSDRRPLAALARALDRLDTPAGRSVAQHVREASRQVAAIELGSCSRRLEGQRRYESAVRSAFQAANAVPPLWLASASAAYEDTATDIALPPLGEVVRDELVRLGDLLWPRVVRAGIARSLVQGFVARFGVGGELADVFAWLCDEAAALASKSVSMSDGTRGVGPALRVGRSETWPHVGILFQLAAADSDAIRRGSFLLVVNQLTSGAGASLLRFSSLAPANLDVEGSTVSWIRALHPEARVVELPICAEWNSMQYQALGRFPTLEWPGEWPVVNAPDLRLRDLSMVHDSESDSLVLLDPDGQPVAPHYVGIVPHHLANGPLGLLLTLLDPWIPLLEAGSGPERGRPFAGIPSDVEAYPRETSGRIVLRRQRWRMPLSAFPRKTRAEQDLDFLQRADAWRRHHGMPREVFVRAEWPVPHRDPVRRKPVWLAFDSLHSLLAAGAVLSDDTPCVLVEEALPDRTQHWIRDPAGKPRAAEFLALLRWSDARPRDAGADG